MSIEHQIEFAAATLLPRVLKGTEAEDTWYGTFTDVLVWYLESTGLNISKLSEIVEEIVSGRFSSWVEPSAEEARSICRSLLNPWPNSLGL